MKLLVRGGSIAAGYGVRKGYVDTVAAALQPRRIEVINRSRFRETSFDGIATFDEDIAPCRPQILLIHFGVDDAFHPVYRSEFQENLVRLIRLSRRRFDPLILLATSHTFDNPHDMEAVAIYYRSLRIVASDLACVLVPVHLRWAGYLSENGLSGADLVQPDDRHPNERGHQVIAEAVMTTIREVLQLSF